MACEFVAAAGCAVEFGCHLVADPFPYAAEVCFAGGAAERSGGDGVVDDTGLSVELVEKNGFYVFANGSQLGVFEGSQVTDELLGFCALDLVGFATHGCHGVTHAWVGTREGRECKQCIAEARKALHDGQMDRRLGIGRNIGVEPGNASFYTDCALGISRNCERRKSLDLRTNLGFGEYDPVTGYALVQQYSVKCIPGTWAASCLFG